MLRSEDKSGSRQAHRITVRQMESLIRLSEACAKAELSTVVAMQHVQLAVQLLRSSIIDVELDDNQEFDLGGPEALENFQPDMENQEAHDRSIRLTYTQYKDYLREIIQIVDTYCMQGEDPTQAAVIESYLQKKVDFFKSEEEETRVASVLDHVIDYMIGKERVLVSPFYSRS